MHTRISIILLALVSFTVFSKNSPILISIESDIYNYAQEIIADQPILEVEDYSGKNSQRNVVELIFAQQALKLGGYHGEFEFKLGDYDLLNPLLVKSDLLLISFDSVWLSHAQKISDDVYISDPLVRKGEFWAGIYTAANNSKARKIANREDFQSMTVVSSKDWQVDWQTLQALKPEKLVHENEWISMAKMVSKGWIDVMLAPFRYQAPHVYTGVGYEVVAVSGVKVGLDDSRHFIVSKKHPKGKEVFTALQKGLKILRERGVIEKAYKQAGFFNQSVASWKVINQ